MRRGNYDFYVYIMSSQSGVLYIDVTNDLLRRVEEHKKIALFNSLNPKWSDLYLEWVT